MAIARNILVLILIFCLVSVIQSQDDAITLEPTFITDGGYSVFGVKWCPHDLCAIVDGLNQLQFLNFKANLLFTIATDDDFNNALLLDMLFTPTGDKFLVWSSLKEQDDISLWRLDIEKDKYPQNYLNLSTENITYIHWNNAGDKFLLGNETRQIVEIWDALSGQKLLELPGLNGIWSDDDQQVLTWSWYDKYVWHFDAITGVEIQRLEQTGHMFRLEWDEINQRVLVNGDEISVWDLVNGEKLFSFPIEGDAFFNQDKSLLAVFDNTHDVVNIASPIDGHVMMSFPIPADKRIGYLRWNQSNSYILGDMSTSGCENNCFDQSVVLDLEQNQVIEGMQNSRVWQSMWINDFRAAIVTGSNVLIWDVRSGDVQFTLPHDDEVQGFYENTSGTQLFSWTDQIAYMWDIPK